MGIERFFFKGPVSGGVHDEGRKIILGSDQVVLQSPPSDRHRSDPKLWALQIGCLAIIVVMVWLATSYILVMVWLATGYILGHTIFIWSLGFVLLIGLVLLAKYLLGERARWNWKQSIGPLSEQDATTLWDLTVTGRRVFTQGSYVKVVKAGKGAVRFMAIAKDETYVLYKDFDCTQPLSFDEAKQMLVKLAEHREAKRQEKLDKKAQALLAKVQAVREQYEQQAHN